MPIFRYYPSNPATLDTETETKIFIHSLLAPAVVVALMWLVKLVEISADLDFSRYGIFPLQVRGLKGVLFAPFIHVDFSHLISNSLPFFILGFMLVYFYRRVSYQIFFLLYILSGLSTWIIGREAWHIGASGVVYALAAFHFVSGIIRSDVRLLTLSVIVVFLYGGLVWGLLPVRPEVSWEGHLSGSIWGVALAFLYRKFVIRREKYDWEYDDDNDELEDENDENDSDTSSFQNITTS